MDESLKLVLTNDQIDEALLVWCGRNTPSKLLPMFRKSFRDAVHAMNITPPKRPWVELTDNEIALIHADYPHPQGFAKAIEAKLKEKNT